MSAAAANYPTVPIVPLEFFFASVLPHVLSSTLAAVVEDLKATKWITQSGAPKGYTIAQAKQKAKAKYYSPLHAFIEEAKHKGKKVYGIAPCLEHIHNPKSTPQRTGIASRHENCTLLEDASDVWGSIVVVEENTLVNDINGQRDNWSNILWTAQHILKNDPRRNCTFGRTIEGRDTRFWFFARSHIMVTEPFDFVQHYEHIVRFTLALAFAHFNPATNTADSVLGLTRLGYDTTIVRSEDASYTVFVNGTPYIVIDTLSDSRAGCICGPATRVWRAYEKSQGPGSKEYAIKDIWVHIDSVGEPQILGELKVLLRPVGLDKHLLTVVAHGPVCVDGNEVTSNSLMNGEDLPDDLSYLDTAPASKAFIHSLAGSLESLIPYSVIADGLLRVSGVQRPFRKLKHERIVFAEVGVPYHASHNLHDCMTMVKEAAHVLGAVWKCGHYTHRDISIGNLLWHEGHVLVTDWEFRQCYDDEVTGKEAKMGTPAYMAVEASNQLWMHSTNMEITMDIAPAVVNFKHNPLHDLESLWRIMMWTFLGSVPISLLGSMSPQRLTNQWTTYRTRFPQDGINFTLFDFESCSSSPGCSLNVLHKALLPITNRVGKLGVLLRYWHERAEAGSLPPPVESATFTDSHVTFCRQLDMILEDLQRDRYAPFKWLSVIAQGE